MTLVTRGIFVVLIASFLVGCGVQQDPVGYYTSQELGRVKSLIRYHLFNEGRTSGTELELKRDSTFTMRTCANDIEGKWSIKRDSIFLKPYKNMFIIDSLNDPGNPLSLAEFGYKLRNNSLRQRVSSDERNHQIIEVLVKANMAHKE